VESIRRAAIVAAAVLAVALATTPAIAAPQTQLALGPADLRIEQRTDGGYHLYIRAKPGLGSVLLTESTKDPALQADNYSYRALEKNAVNGDEKRMLDGKFIPVSSGIYSLVDSTPEPDAAFGSAFHVFIPWVVAWGYPWSRNGRTFISDGTFINVRTFAKPYADYTGAFADNPFLVRVTQAPAPRKAPEPKKEEPAKAAPPPPPEKKPDPDLYMPETVRSFESLAKATKGDIRYADETEDVAPQIASLLDRAEGETLDLVVCLDTTDSMRDDIDAVKSMLPGLVKEKLAKTRSYRIGFVPYKDYFEDYLYKRYDFSADVSTFFSELAGIRVGGGRDIPEAVYEALFEALTEFDWSAEKRMIILIGDAPPHPIPRGKVDKAMVESEAAKLGVEMDVIILPH
jgi:hypothetical protein